MNKIDPAVRRSLEIAAVMAQGHTFEQAFTVVTGRTIDEFRQALIDHGLAARTADERVGQLRHAVIRIHRKYGTVLLEPNAIDALLSLIQRERRK